MKSKRILALIGVLIAVAALAGFKYWDQRQQAAAEERETQAIAERQRADLAGRMIGSVRLIEDYAVPRQEINERHQQLLAQVRQTKSEYIVFPPSAPKFRAGLDLTGRIAIAREIAQRVEAETGVPVPDPGLVFEAYDAPRRIDVDMVPVRLLESNVKWLIGGTAMHDGHGKMSVKLVKIPVKGNRPTTLPTFERADVAISEEQLPEAVFRTMAADAMKSLGFQSAAPTLVKEDAPAELSLPASPIAAEGAQKSLTEGLWLQQMIGVLHHPLTHADPRPPERVFERTLAGVETLSPDSGDYAILKARALLHLGRPIAAMKQLEPAANTPEGKALLAYLKSDLPALKSAVAEIRRQIPRMIAECELLTLRQEFGDLSENDQRKETERLVSRLPIGWQPLFAFFVAHQNLWTMPAPSQLKPLLDQNFPVEGYRTEDLVRGKEALGASPMDEKTAMELIVSPLVHSSKWRAANPTAACCESGSRNWARYDRVVYLDLLDAMAEGELSGRVEFLMDVQGRPDAALRQADAIDRALYHGVNSQIMSARLQALLEVPPEGRDRTRTLQVTLETHELAKKILSWDSAQSFATAEALYIDTRAGARGTIPVPSRTSLPPGVDTMVFDFPRRALWASRGAYGVFDAALGDAIRRDACRLSIGQYYFCEDYLRNLRPKVSRAVYRKEIADLIEPRFGGSSSRAVLLSKLKLEDRDFAGAERLLEDAVAASPAQEQLYTSLGSLRLKDGRYAEAAKTFLSYPQLKEGASNTVGLSNYLERAGFSFLSRAAVAEARQLLSVAAGYQDGSYANLASVAQVALMDGRYELAREALQDQYQRYHSHGSARKLVSLLFMMGDTEQAWSALKNATTHGDPSEASTVGLRASRSDPERIAAWGAAHADEAKNYAQSIWVTFHMLSMDRPGSTMRSIYEIDAKARAQMKILRVQEPPLDAKNAEALSRTSLPQPAYIEGYAAFKEREYAKALSALQPLYAPQKRDPTRSQKGRHWELFPHLAFVMAKSGTGDDAIALVQHLEKTAPEDEESDDDSDEEVIPDFQEHLVLAIGHAFKGEHAQAENEIEKARAGIWGRGGMLESAYTFVEILERLAEETKHHEYLNFAVEHARAYQRFEPWAAWAYAFEARYAQAGPARTRAAGIALKLDPMSHWLSQLDQPTLQQARQWAARNRWPGKDSPNVPAKWNQT